MTLRDAQIDPRKSYYDKLTQVESGGNPNAKSKSSTAAGLYQFVERTWTGLVDKYKLGFGLEDRFDPIKSKIVLDKLTDENERYLKRRLGRTPTDDELYMAHFLGMGGAAKFYEALREDPSTPVVSVIGERSYKSNQSVFKNRQTLRDVAQWAKEKMNMPIGGIERPNQTESGIIPFHSNFEEPTTAIDNSSEGAKLLFQENEEERTASENLDREERKEKVFEQYRRVPQGQQLAQAPQYQQQDILRKFKKKAY